MTVKRMTLKPQFRTHKQAMTTLGNAQKANHKRSENAKLHRAIVAVAVKFNSARIH